MFSRKININLHPLALRFIILISAYHFISPYLFAYFIWSDRRRIAQMFRKRSGIQFFDGPIFTVRPDKQFRLKITENFVSKRFDFMFRSSNARLGKCTTHYVHGSVTLTRLKRVFVSTVIVVLNLKCSFLSIVVIVINVLALTFAPTVKSENCEKEIEKRQSIQLVTCYDGGHESC